MSNTANHAHGPSWSFVIYFLVLFALSTIATPAGVHAAEMDQARANEKNTLDRLAYSSPEIGSAEWMEALSAFEKIGSVAMRPSDWRNLIRIGMRSWNFRFVSGLKRHAAAAALIEDLELPKNFDSLDEASRANFWQLHEDKLQPMQANVVAGPSVLVAFHPRCGPCRRMLADIAKDERVLAGMRQCGAWIGLVEQTFRRSEFSAWEVKALGVPVRFIKRWRQLGLNEPSATPLIHLLSDGAPADTLLGWPIEGRMDDLRKHLLGENGAPKCSVPSRSQALEPAHKGYEAAHR